MIDAAVSWKKVQHRRKNYYANNCNPCTNFLVVEEQTDEKFHGVYSSVLGYRKTLKPNSELQSPIFADCQRQKF
uniref:Uncharacterized protein n=1 Tax=Romanomermis culicivorax TaxID=13658 RepID=A0A915KR23_ROMCU